MYLNSFFLKSNTFQVSIFLGFIISLGLFFRLNYVDYEIPLTLDSLRYFLLGMDISILGNLPEYYNRANSGWPLFLSVVFQMSDSENYLDYMAIQRTCTIFFSLITSVSMYFLARKFFKKEIAILGASFFIFSPFIVENSLLGINDSLFLFLTTTYLGLFFSQRKFNVLISFIVLGLSTLVRYESLLLIIPTIIIFLFKYKNSDFKKYLVVGLILFLLVIVPVSIWKIQMGIPDGITSHLFDGATVVINENNINSNTSDRFDFFRGIIETPKFIGFSLLPLCFIFVPYSIVNLIKKHDINFRYLIFVGIFSLIPAFYAYSRGFEEIRYVLFILPIVIISSLFLIEKIDSRIKKNGLVVIILITVMILSSFVHLELRQQDYEYEKEAIEVARYVSTLPGIINDYGSESHYVEVMELENVFFPVLSTDINFQKKIVYVSEETIEEIHEYLKNGKLSYFGITESKSNNNPVLKEIYMEKSSDFEKIYDSTQTNTKFKIKIFQLIDED